MSVAPSGVDTYFSETSLDESMWITGIMAPWVGRGLEAGFSVNRLVDNTAVEGALSYQWYRVHPFTYERTLIPEATGTSYVTTEDELGGWLLMCEASGDGVQAGGFARIISSSGIFIPNPAFASGVQASGFRLNLLRAVPSLDAADLNVRYYNAQWEEITLPVTAVTSVEGMAVFDVQVDIPPGVTQLWVNTNSQVWQLATLMFEDHYMEGLMIVIAPAGFDAWINAQPGIPTEQREPLDRNGPLALTNLLAYAIGVNPLDATPENLPQVAGLVAATIKIRFRRSTNAGDVQLTLQSCPDLTSWQAANILTSNVIETGEGFEIVEVEVPASGSGSGFFRLEAILSGSGG